MHNNRFKHIGIIGKYGADYVGEAINSVIQLVDARNINVTLDSETMPDTLKQHPCAKPLTQWSDKIDLAIVIGGDGTFLHAGRELLAKNTPLLGINSGRLGFLADLPQQDIEAQLTRILNGDYSVESRQTLDVTILRERQTIAQFTAINDAVIHKRNMARMIDLSVAVGHRFMTNYRADGLILSTPTGSTAYALSAGGPIIEPSLEVILIVPICPHTLTHRPIVINAHSHIEVDVSVQSFKDIQVTIDGQEEQIIEPGDKVIITSGQLLPVIHPADYRFQDRLRHKLNWGVSPDQTTSERYA